MSTEPKRLRLGSGPLATSVASLQGALPPEERMAALAERLARAGAPVGEVAAEAAPSSSTLERAPRPSRRLARAAKVFGPGTLAVLAALVFGGGLIATVILIREPESPLMPPSEPVPPLGAPSHPAVPPPLASPLAAPVAPPLVAPPAAKAGDTPAPAPAPLESDRPELAGDSVTPPTRAGSDARLAPAPPPPQPAASDETRPSGPSTRAKPAAATPPSEGAPLAASTVVESEIELLKQARSALGADPLQAYALSERCRAQYPSGAFAQEREYIAISALSRLGRTSEARSRASLFRMHYPNSAYLPRLARILGE